MRAILLEGFGGVDQLHIGDVPKPTPQDHEVLIKIHYTAVNPVDWKVRSGLLKNRMPHEFPIIPGWDASGVVEAVGKQVERFKPGDEVFAYCRKPTIHSGTYAEYVTVPADNVAFKPKKLSFAEAAAIPLAGLTAWQALFDAAKLKKGDRVLIHAGAGGVGSLAIQFAKAAGAFVYTTASQANHDYVKKLGADVAIDYKQQSFIDVIKEQVPNGIDVVFDCIGGQTQRDSYQVIRGGGCLVSIVDPPNPQLAEQFDVRAEYVFVNPNGQQLQKIADLIDQGRVQPLHIEEMPLEKAGEAQERNREGHTKGKIVLRVNGTRA